MSFIKRIKNNLNNSNDYIFKELNIDNTRCNIIYNEVLTSTYFINNFVLSSLISLDKKDFKNIINLLPDNNILIINKKDIYYYLNNGFLILIIRSYIYAIEVRTNLHRSIGTVSSELSIMGPKDAFTEDFNINLGLIRRRIKTESLINNSFIVGKCSNTKIGVLYIDGICNKKLVKNVIKKIKSINIDGIIDSGYLRSYLEYNKSLFPTIIMTERPDRSSMALLEGKIVIITDCSPYVIILPNFFIDYFHTVDDYYQKSLNTTFTRLIRLFAFFISILTPSIYLALTTRNYGLLPIKLLYVLKAGRSFVPFSALIEALLMILSFEILKESDIRMSNTSSSSVSILGGLILGDAAVSAGIVSPIMIIVIAISSIAGLVFNSIELVNTIRIYKIGFLILSYFLGLYGIVVGLGILYLDLNHVNNFNIPYLSQIIPFYKNNINDSIYKTGYNTKYRNSYISKNIIRGRSK